MTWQTRPGDHRGRWSGSAMLTCVGPRTRKPFAAALAAGAVNNAWRGFLRTRRLVQVADMAKRKIKAGQVGLTEELERPLRTNRYESGVGFLVRSRITALRSTAGSRY
jgi:hypothetical protein